MADVIRGIAAHTTPAEIDAPRAKRADIQAANAQSFVKLSKSKTPQEASKNTINGQTVKKLARQRTRENFNEAYADDLEELHKRTTVVLEIAKAIVMKIRTKHIVKAILSGLLAIFSKSVIPSDEGKKE